MSLPLLDDNNAEPDKASADDENMTSYQYHHADDKNNPSKGVSSSSSSGSSSTIHLRLRPPLSSSNDDSAVAASTAALVLTNLCLTTPVLHHHHPHDTTTTTRQLQQQQQQPAPPRVLIRNLDLTVHWGQRLLIVGASGTGKSSLLRALAGLWTAGSGTIDRPALPDVYFLPQKPYCSTGSLRDQLLYPCISCSSSSVVVAEEEDYDLDKNHGNNTRNSQAQHHHHVRGQQQQRRQGPNLSNDDLLNILRAVDLAELPQRAAASSSSTSTNDSTASVATPAMKTIHVNDDNDKDNRDNETATSLRQDANIQGLDTVLDWSNVLSLGEQQRLAFGRLLVNQPRFVILDESTSALDVDAERRMYALLQKTTSNNNSMAMTPTTYVSVGHRPTLLQYHDTKLTLNGDQHCTVEPIRQSSSSSSPSDDAVLFG